MAEPNDNISVSDPTKELLDEITDNLQDFYRYYETYLHDSRQKYIDSENLPEQERKHRAALAASEKNLAEFLALGLGGSLRDSVELKRRNIMKIEAKLTEYETWKADFSIFEKKYGTLDQVKETIQVKREGILANIDKLRNMKLSFDIDDLLVKLIDTVRRFELNTRKLGGNDYLKIALYDIHKVSLERYWISIRRQYNEDYERKEKKEKLIENKIEPVPRSEKTDTSDGEQMINKLIDSLDDFYRYYETYLHDSRQKYIDSENLPEQERKHRAALAASEKNLAEFLALGLGGSLRDSVELKRRNIKKIEAKLTEYETGKADFSIFEKKYGTLDQVKETIRVKREGILAKISELRSAGTNMIKNNIMTSILGSLSDNVTRFELETRPRVPDDYLKIGRYYELKEMLNQSIFELERESLLVRERGAKMTKRPVQRGVDWME